MELKAVGYAMDERVATITLNRPHRMNAWTGRMHTEYRWCVQQAEDDPEVRAIVVTGAGRAFCAGADATALEGHIEKGGYDPGTNAAELATPGYGVRPEFDENFAYHFGLTKPVIAAINGPAAGVGLVLACYADIRFAVADAKLTTSHGKLGLPAEYGLSWLLPRLIGVSRANDMLLSSRVVLASEGERMGLINAVFETPGEMLEHANGYARMLATQVAPSSLRETKRQLYADLLHGDVGASVRESEALLNRMMTEPDFREGVRAFVGKRPPAF